MSPDEQPIPRTQTHPGASHPDPQVAAVLAALAGRLDSHDARIDSLEQELAQLRASQAHPHPEANLTPTPPPPATPPLHPQKPKASLEDRIGSQLFSRIGIIALLIATALFLKWAIDNQWIGPLGRILAGLLAGAAVILWSERFRRHNFPAFAYSLKAIGSGALYLSLWAAFQLYHLLPAPAALAAMVLVTIWNAYMAWSQSSELLAAYSLTGALATPLLLSTGGNHEIFLFTYLLILDLATIALVRLKPWPRLLLGAFPATAIYFIAWYISWYDYSSTHQPVAITSFFLALFFLVFLTPSFRTAPGQQSADAPDSSPHEAPAHAPAYAPIPEVFLPLANAAFTAFALYCVLDENHYRDLRPWVAVLLAAIYLALTRLSAPRLQTRVTSALHLTLSIVFLTIAIPLKATGHWITVGWLTEAVALLWISARLTSRTLTIRVTSTEPNAVLTLRRLALLALTLGFFGLLLQPLWLYPIPQTAFLNSRFATALFGIAAFAAAIAIALHARRQEDTASPGWLSIAAASILALNLTAILASVRELDTTWSNITGNPDAELQKSLAISAFLMLYGAALLAAGFWKRSAFLRWQALVLLVFTIGKTFLYDLRNLSQGYRVFSFLGLGALLMAISFAYQKDWLALRDPSKE